MKVLAVTIVCLVTITTTHGFGIGFPPFGGIVRPPFGFRIPHFGPGIPPFGHGIAPYGLGISPYGLGVSPLGLGSGLPNQGLIQQGLQGSGVIQTNDNGPVYVDLDANAAAAAAPTTIAATAQTGSAAYVPAYMAL